MITNVLIFTINSIDNSIPTTYSCKKPNKRPVSDVSHICSKTNGMGCLLDLCGYAKYLVLLITILHRQQSFSAMSYMVQTYLTYCNFDLLGVCVT